MTKKRIFFAGVSGIAGQTTLKALQEAGHEVVCFCRTAVDLDCEVRLGDFTSEASLARDGFQGEQFDVVISCIASHSGAPSHAWAVDHDAQLTLLRSAQGAGVPHFIVLSALCVQKPKLAFQRAKLAFEKELISSGLTYSIVRPTAIFEALSGQVENVRAGKPFLVFGDGRLTACKPISETDLGKFIAGCVDDPARANAVLPIGGPGPAITPVEQAEALFKLLDKPVKIKRVPLAPMIVGGVALRALGKINPKMADQAEALGIGRYYATESMLVWDAEHRRYDAEATPETGEDQLFDFYENLITESPSVN